MEVIDPEGDVAVTYSGTASFLVSKKVLALASSPLRELLKSPSAGGLAVRSVTNNHPLLNLPQDDPDAFHLLQQKHADAHVKIQAAVLSPIDKLNKFDCFKAKVFLAGYIRDQRQPEFSQMNLADFYRNVKVLARPVYVPEKAAPAPLSRDTAQLRN
ncbi:hypothetical protein BDW68DRAFT_181726 [Aspergillus falconensis]